MAKKIRDYVYGSPKFEKELNKAVSEAGGGKIYRHNIYMVCDDAEHNTYYANFEIYTTTADELLDAHTATINDLVTLLKTYCAIHATPYLLEDYIFYSLYVKNDNTLWGISINVANQTNAKKAIATITAAYDIVMEM